MFVIKFNFEWITLAVKQISGITRKPIWVIKEQNMQTFILRLACVAGAKRGGGGGGGREKGTPYPFRRLLRRLFCVPYLHRFMSVQKWTSVKHDLFRCLARDRKSPPHRIVFGQKLIWRKVCWINSLPSTRLIWVVTPDTLSRVSGKLRPKT